MKQTIILFPRLTCILHSVVQIWTCRIFRFDRHLVLLVGSSDMIPMVYLGLLYRNHIWGNYVFIKYNCCSNIAGSVISSTKEPRENARASGEDFSHPSHMRLLSRAALAWLLATPPNGEIARSLPGFMPQLIPVLSHRKWQGRPVEVIWWFHSSGS